MCVCVCLCVCASVFVCVVGQWSFIQACLIK